MYDSSATAVSNSSDCRRHWAAETCCRRRCYRHPVAACGVADVAGDLFEGSLLLASGELKTVQYGGPTRQ